MRCWPIAGTHPRGSGEEDELLKQQLVNHPKEQAEHINNQRFKDLRIQHSIKVVYRNIDAP
jgi:hypothetical protein